MSDLRNSNPYNLKKQKDKGYLYKEKPAGYLSSEEFISFLNRKKILIERSDNLPRFASNNNIVMAKIKREKSNGSTPTVYKIPSDSKIEEIIKIHKNNNNSLVGRILLKKKKKKILEIFDNAPSAKEYDKKMQDATEEKKKEIVKIKWQKCLTKTSIAKKVSALLEVNCNRKLVASILDKKRSSQLDKLLKKE